MRMNANCEMRSESMEKRAAASDGGAPGRSALLREGLPGRLRFRDTPARRITRSVLRGGGGGEASLKNSKIGCTSRGASNFSRWPRSIRKNIIGHGMRPGTWHGVGRGMAARREQISARGVLGSAGRAFALLDEPAGEHGAGVLFHPLIEQSANLFAEIGGVGQTGKFVALERIARGREKKLPRRLGWGTGHVSLLRRTCAR